VLFSDLHVQSKGLWLGRSEGPDRLVPIRRVAGPGALLVVDRVHGAVYRYVADGRLARLDPVSGRETPVPGTFSGLTRDSELRIGPDGRTLLYTEIVPGARVMVGEGVR
jgi:hypothetical protein